MTNQCSNDPMTNDPNEAPAIVAFVWVIGSFEFRVKRGARYTFPMQRFLLALLVSTTLAMGPGPLQKLHESTIDHFWQQHAALLASVEGHPRTPPDRLPGRPAHDPSKCNFCIALHAPLLVELAATSVTRPGACFGNLPLCASPQYFSGFVTSSNCRGPPVV
jgi:hypothetical protein